MTTASIWLDAMSRERAQKAVPNARRMVAFLRANWSASVITDRSGLGRQTWIRLMTDYETQRPSAIAEKGRV